MRWSRRQDDDNLTSILHGESGGRLGSALAELREQAPTAPSELRERVRLLAAEEPVEEAGRRPRRGRYQLSVARAGALAAAVLAVAVAVPAIGALTDGDRGSLESVDEASSGRETSPPGQPGDNDLAPLAPPAPPSPGFAPPVPKAEHSPGGGSAAPSPPSAADARRDAAPLPSTNRAQDYSASIKLHVDDQDELSDAVQSAIRTTRQLGGYVTYVDYGTSGADTGDATLAVRVPVGRVQNAVARFSQLGTILQQQTEIVDLQGRIDRITRDIQQRRDRVARLEAELKDPTLSEAERDRLEARLVRAKRGLANATRERSGVIRQSRFAKLDLAFTTEKQAEPAAPPSELRRTLDDALGILAAELGILLYVLIAGAPFFALALLAVLGARALRRGGDRRVLEQA